MGTAMKSNYMQEHLERGSENKWCNVLPTTITLMKAITSAKNITWVITSAHMLQNLPKLNRQ